MQALVDATWCCPEALRVNYPLPIHRGYRQGTNPSCQAHPVCLSCTGPPHQGCKLPGEAHTTSHDGAKQSCTGSAISAFPRTTPMGNALFRLPQPMLNLHPKLTSSPTQSCCLKITSIDSIQTSCIPTRISASLREPNLRHRKAEI